MKQTVEIPMGSDAFRIFSCGMPQRPELADFFDQPDLKFSGMKELVILNEVNLGYGDSNIFKANGLTDETVQKADREIAKISMTRAIINHNIHTKHLNAKKRKPKLQRLSRINPKANVPHNEDHEVTVYQMYDIKPRITFVEYSLLMPDNRQEMFDHIRDFFNYVDGIRMGRINSEYADFISRTDITWSRPVLAHKYNEIYGALHVEFMTLYNIPTTRFDFSLHYDALMQKTIPTFIMGD